jgi:hypothetical protein
METDHAPRKQPKQSNPPYVFPYTANNAILSGFTGYGSFPYLCRPRYIQPSFF